MSRRRFFAGLSFNALSVRLVAGALLWSLLCFTVGGLVLTKVFREAAERFLDDRLGVVMDNLLADLTIAEDGSIVFKRGMSDARFDRVYSGWYWQVAALGTAPDGSTHAPVRSRSLWDEAIQLRAEPPRRGSTRSYTLGPDGQSLRVVERRVGIPGAKTPLRVAVAADVSEMQREIQAFQKTLARGLVLMALVLAVSLVLQVRLGLAPLEQVRDGLAAIRDGRAERLNGRFPSEIAPLADELNRVLDHNQSVVERARTQVGNLAHALKTPLSVLKTSAERDQGALAGPVLRETTTMRRQVDHYLARARMAASADVLGTRTELHGVIEDILRTLRRLNMDRSLDVDFEVPASLAIRGERSDLEDMVGNLLDNAFKWAASRIAITARLDGDMVLLTIGDDGPGLEPEQCHAALQRGVRLDETVPGSGLGLAIVDDIAQAHRGDFSLDRSPLGGLEARLSLPRA